MSKRSVILFIIISSALNIYSQDIKNLQETFLESEYFFIKEDYADALPGYLQIHEKMPANANIEYKTGVCYLNIPGRKNLATEFLEAASRNVSSRIKEGKLTQTAAPYDAIYQLGIACRINHQFEKAKEAFGKYKETLLKDDKENIDFIDHEIKTCDNAKIMIEKPIDFKAENIGNNFNDASDNYNSVISADGNSFIFMNSLPFYEAVMYSVLVDGKWTSPVNITSDLQVDGDISVSSLSADGKMFYLSLDDNFNSDLLYSIYDGKKWSKAVKLNKNINTKYWESHAFVTDDGNYMIFASDRPGGFGGLDLYITKKEKGDWGYPVNLGPEINSRFNEDMPFLMLKGKLLFFASQDHDNIGGYDIFRSEKQENGLWSKPQNMGYPFNTTDDDTFFMPVENGKAGYVSIFREAEGYGKRDIYKISFK